MRKLTKLLAVLLTVCALAGIIAVSVSASSSASRENNLIPVVNGEYLEHFSKSATDFESANVGNITTYPGWSGQQGGADKTTLDWYIGGESVDGEYVNKYMNFLHYVNDTAPASTSTIQPYIKTGDWGTSDATCLDRNMVGAYDYIVVDFEYGTDRYKYFDGTGYVTYTPEELEDAGLTPDSEGVSLALQHDSSIYPQIRGLKNASLGTWTNNGQSNSCQLYVKEIDGEFYFEHNATKKLVKLSNEINYFDHVTIVVRVTANNMDGDTVKSVNYAVDFFVNGEYMGTNTASSWQSVSLDFVCTAIPASVRNKDAYSLCLDNFTTNYYKMGYTSGSAYGLDDYYKSFNSAKPADFTELDDVVYNYDYETHRYVEFKDGDKVYSEIKAREMISELKGFTYIESTMRLTDLEVSKDLKELIVYTDKAVSLANDGGRNLIAAKIYGGYEIREATEDDYYSIKWYSANDELIATTTHLFGADIDPINPNYSDAAAGKIYIAKDAEWMLTVNGEDESLRPIEYGEIEAGETVSAYLLAEYEVKSVQFFVGEYSESLKMVLPVSDVNGGYDLYATADIAKIKAELEAIRGEKTLVLCSDVSFVGWNVNLSAGATVSFDLNGYDILRVGGSSKNNSQMGGLFYIAEGTTFNLYSSRAGARIFDASPYTAATNATLDGVEGKYATDDISYSTGGFIRVPEAVDECLVTVGAFRGYEANLEYNGGTFFYAWGYNYRDNGGDWNEFVNDKKRTFIINGGDYYMPARPAYAFASTTGPDVVWKFNDANFYVSNASYALIHDYDDGRFSVNSEAYLNNCKILAVNLDNIGRPVYKVNSGVATFSETTGGSIGSYAKVFHTIGSKSKVYITDCEIIGQLFSAYKAGCEVYLGGNNLISTNQTLQNYSFIKAMDGSDIVYATSTDNTFDITLSFAHPKLYADYEQYLTLSADQNNWELKSGVFDGADVVATATKRVNVITVANDELPEIAKDYVAPITWLDTEGKTYAITFAFYNDNIAKLPAGDFGITELDNGWYDVGYGDWTNITEGAGADSLIAIKGKDNKFAPKKTLLADIEGTKAKMAFYYSQYEFWFYFPKPAADSGIVYYHMGNDPAESDKTGWYYSQNIYSNTAPYNASGYLGEWNGYYYNWFYPNQDAVDIAERAIKFRVAEYDLNGDGVITDDEKNITLVQNVNISIPRYAETILNYYGHGSEETRLSYELMRYMYEVRAYGGRTTDFFDSYEKAYFAKCDCEGAALKKCDHVYDLDSMDLSEYKSELGDLPDFVYGANFNLNVARATSYLYLLPIDGEYKITIYGTKLTKSGDKVVEATEGISATRDASKDITVTLPDGTSVKVLAYKLGIKRVQWLTYGYDITVTANYNDEAKEDVTVRGVYSLMDYIENNPNVRAAKSLYAFAATAWDYVTITKSEKNQ